MEPAIFTEQKLKEENQCVNNSCLFKSTLFRIYGLASHSSQTQITVAIITLQTNQQYQFSHYQSYPFKGNRLFCTKLSTAEELDNWVRMLLLRKKIFGLPLPNSQRAPSSPISIFDCFLVQTNDQCHYGLYPVQKVETIGGSMWGESGQEIKKQLFSALADYHSQNIVLRSIQVHQTALSQKSNRKTIQLMLGQNSLLLNYPEGHLHWLELQQDPYQQDRVILQDYLSSITCRVSCFQEQPLTIQPPFNFKQLLNRIELLETVYTSSFSKFKSAYQELYNKPFIVSDNAFLCLALKEYYSLCGLWQNESLLMEQQLEERRETYKQKWESLQQIDQCIAIQNHLLAGRKAPLPSNSKSSPLQQIQQNQLTYYQYLFNLNLSTSSPLTLEALVSSLTPTGSTQALLYHFLKAKIATRACHFYRSLAHLNQCKKLTAEASQLSSIFLQAGRNEELIGQPVKAEQSYRESLRLRQEEYGKNHQLVLTPLHNLLMLSMKQANVQKAEEIKCRIEQIHQFWGRRKEEYTQTQQIRNADEIEELKNSLVGEQFYSQTLNISKRHLSQQSKPQVERSLNKELFMKKQSLSLPIISDLWNTAKQALEKSSSPAKLQSQLDKLAEQLNQLPRSAVLQNAHFFIELAAYILKGVKRANSQFKERIESHLAQTNTSDIKNQHRLLFLVSFLLEQEQKFLEAARCIQLILNFDHNDRPLYSKASLASLKERFVALLKLIAEPARIIAFHNSQNIIKNGEMEELYYYITLLEQQRQYARCIRVGLHYLNSIKQYPTQQESSQEEAGERAQKKDKLTDRSNSVRLILVKAYIELRNYQYAAVLLQRLSISKKTTRIKAIRSILYRFVIQTLRAEEFWLNYRGLQIIFRTKLTQSSPTKQLQINLNQAELTQLWWAVLKVISKLKGELQDFPQFKEWLMQNQPLNASVPDFIDPLLAAEWHFTSNSKDSSPPLIQALSLQIEKAYQFSLGATNKRQESQNPQIIEKRIHQLVNQNSSNFAIFYQQLEKTAFKISKSACLKILFQEINKLAPRQGTRSAPILWLHLFALKLSSEISFKYAELCILLWLGPFRDNLQIADEQSNGEFWMSKVGRDLRLDGVLNLYLQASKQVESSREADSQLISPLSELWWFSTILVDLNWMKKIYSKILNWQQKWDEERLWTTILNFKIKYSSYLGSELSESDTLSAIVQIENSLNFSVYEDQ